MRYDGRSMEKILNIYKPQGLTPLQALDVIRDIWPEYRDEKITYAGRLDPMAEGVLIVLIGDVVHQKEVYLKLDKIYEADIILGIGTDTHDVLGLPMLYPLTGITKEKIEAAMATMRGCSEYTLPIYSSKPVQGKPLFQWAREGRLSEIKIPKRAMHVYNAELLDHYEIDDKEMMQHIEASVKKVQGDFRQGEIVNAWRVLLADSTAKSTFPMIRIRIHCASGTYIRTLAHELGKRLDTDAVVARLVRTQVGDFAMCNANRIE